MKKGIENVTAVYAEPSCLRTTQTFVVVILTAATQ